MLRNYLLIAIRHILKNKLYSSINILGLVVGLTVYLFGSILADYEQTHDAFFENSDRIFTVGSIFSATANLGILSLDSVHSALGSIIKAEIPELQTLSRSLRKEFLLSIGSDDYYQTLLFVDSEFTRIFNFTYIEGDQGALDDRTGLMITRSAALKYFGEGPAFGKSLTLDHDKSLKVTAVVADLAMNFHFNSSLFNPTKFELATHISVLKKENFNPEEGDWESLNIGDLTYFRVPEGLTREWLQTKMLVSPILKGRALGEVIADDTIKEDVYSANVVVNELLLSKLGYTLDSVNPIFYDFSDERPSRTYSIVGVVPDQNFLGFHNQIRPIVFAQRPESYRIGSIRIQGKGMQATMADIERTWDTVIPEYPIQLRFLDETFDDLFDIFAGISKTLAGFAFLAMTLSMVGLFGLAAYMVERRTREIGIRKVMGANRAQIVRLLIWQFSRPVIWASIIVLPVAYFAANTYLDFFPNRLSLPGGIILLAGCLGVVLSWAVVSVHAMKIEKANPIHALCYE